MGCGSKAHHPGGHGSGHWGGHGRGHGRPHGCDCGCHTAGFRFGHCFATREEKVSWLERYLEGLQEEAQAVEERIAKLKEEA